MIELDKALACEEGFALHSGVAVFSEFRDSLPLLSAREMIRQMDEAGIARGVELLRTAKAAEIKGLAAIERIVQRLPAATREEGKADG